MNPSTKESEIIHRASRCFKSRRALYYYARGKMRHDPAYPLLGRILEKTTRPILDLGCGAGVFAAYLRESGVAAPVYGIDLAGEKISIARQAVASCYPGLHFLQGNALALEEFDSLPAPGAVVALDLLHYFPAAGQIRLLEMLAGRLDSGARLYLRNGVREPSWRYACTLAEEGFVRLSRWIRGGSCNFPTRAFVETELRRHGLHVVTTPLWGRTPFSSLLFTAARR